MQTSMNDPITLLSKLDANALDQAFQDVSPELICSICINPSTDWVVACPNEHSFCRKCFADHIAKTNEEGSTPRCPQCRTNVMKHPELAKPNRILNSITLSTKIQCPQKCGEVHLLSDMVAHIKDKCHNSLISCPYAEMGCTFCLPRGEMQYHLDSDNHARLVVGFYNNSMQTTTKHFDAIMEKLGYLERKVDKNTDRLERLEASVEKIDQSVKIFLDKQNVLNALYADLSKRFVDKQDALSVVCTDLRKTVTKTFDMIMYDGTFSLKHIYNQTKKRASPGEGQSDRSKRHQSQVQRQHAEIQRLKEGIATTATSSAPNANNGSSQTCPAFRDQGQDIGS